MKFCKSKSVIRMIILSLFIILSVYIISNYPGGNQLIQRIIPDNISGRKWNQPRRVRVYTTHLLCGHQDLVVENHPSQRFIKEVTIRRSAHQTDCKVQTQGRVLIYRIQKRDRCQSCDTYQFLGINAQNVVIRYGTPVKPGPIRETLYINVSQLPNSERDDLKRGIRFTDNKEKLQIIEGLSELMGEP